MTFKLFNALTEAFKEHKEVHLRNYAPTDELDSDYGTLVRYDEDSDYRKAQEFANTYKEKCGMNEKDFQDLLTEIVQ